MDNATLRGLMGGDRVYVRSAAGAPWFWAEVKIIGRSEGRGRPLAAYCRPVSADGPVKVPAWYRPCDVTLDAPSYDAPGIVERMLADMTGGAK